MVHRDLSLPSARHRWPERAETRATGTPAAPEPGSPVGEAGDDLLLRELVLHTGALGEPGLLPWMLSVWRGRDGAC